MTRILLLCVCVLWGSACVSPKPRPKAPPVAPVVTPEAPEPVWSEVVSSGLATRHGSTTLLPDGKLLLMGGYIRDDATSEPHATTAVRLYDPQKGTTRVLAPMPERRAYHTAHLLPDGRVGVVGGLTREPGQRFDFAQTTLVFDLTKDTWESGPKHHTPRLFSANVTLPDGRVLLTGGTSSPLHENGLPATAEIVDFGHKSVTSFPIPAPRYQHTATLLPGGDVLVAGGRMPDGPITTSTRYAPTASTWTLSLQGLRITPGPDMSMPRARHAALLLEDGSVFVSGGIRVEADAKRAIPEMERYVPGRSWRPESCVLPRGRFDHVLVKAPGGDVWMVGGSSLGKAETQVFAWREGDDACPRKQGVLRVARHHGLWAGVLGDRVFVLGGSYASGAVEAQ